MIRTFVIFSLSAALIAALSIPVAVMQPGRLVLGGHYRIGPGETLQEDISFYFAQVTIEAGASVDGRLSLYSSTLDLGGRVSEGIHAFDSDLTLRKTASVDGKIDENDFIHWTVLLPAAARLP